MNDVTLITAFAAGTLALLSPCSALLLPSFFAYAFDSRAALVGRTALFYLGLAAVLVPLGMGSSAVSSLVYGNRAAVIAVAGWTIIGLGALQLVGRGFTLPIVGRLVERPGATDLRSRPLSTLTLGTVYGLAGFCSGPVLGAILTVAATEEVPVRGGVLLAVYALGMAAPLFALAAVWDRFELGRRRWLRGREVRLGPVTTHTTSLVSGLLFVGIGVAFLRYDGMVGLTGGLGDTTDLEVDAQSRLASWLGGVPDWSVPALIAAVAGGVAWRRWSAAEADRDQVPEDPAPEGEPGAGADHRLDGARTGSGGR